MSENRSLFDEAAWRMAWGCLDVIEGCLYPDERRDVLEEFTLVCKAEMEAFVVQAVGRHRANPSPN